MHPPFVISAVIAVVGLAIYLIDRRVLEERSDGCWPLMIVVGLLAAVWVPNPWRDGSLVVLLSLFTGGLFSWGAGAAAFVLGAVAALFLPGGAAAALLLVIALVGLLSVKVDRDHLRRLERMQLLEPGNRCDEEVEVTGTVVVTTAIEIPEAGTAAAVTASVEGEPLKFPDGLELDTEVGKVIVDLDKTALSPVQTSNTIRGDDLAILIDQTGWTLPEGQTALLVTWLPVGIEVCVHGKVEWLRDAGRGAYRGGAVIPRFGLDEAKLTDRSPAQIRRHMKLAIATWAVWSVVAAGVVAYLVAASLGK